MKKLIKKIVMCFLFGLFMISAAGCSENDKISELEDRISSLEEQIKKKDESISKLENELDDMKSDFEIYKTGKYQIKVYDIDSELIGDKTLNIRDYNSLYEALSDNFEVEASLTEYGHFLESINGSVKDENYAIFIYENEKAADTGIDNLKIDAGDLFEFKVECFNTSLDEYDLLVDKVIYSYAKNKLKTSFTDDLDILKSNTYWQAMLMNIMNSNSVFDFDFSNKLIENIKSIDVSKLSKANFAKYYYHARLIDNFDFTEFKKVYTTYLNNITEYTSYGEYEYAFTLSIAKELGLEESINSNVINTTYRADTSWGIDGLIWQLTGLALYKDIEDTEFQNIVLTDTSNDVTTASVLLLYAATNKSPRTKDNDIVKTLFDKFYDQETGKFEMEKSGSDYSSNQIYASLAAYKKSRDLNKGVNLFA